MSIQYSFKPELGKVQDFFGLMNLLTRYQKLEDIYANLGLSVSPVIADSYNGISERMKQILPDIELFCSSSPQGISFIYTFLGKDIAGLANISDAIQLIKQKCVSNLVSRLLAFFDEKNNYSEHFYSLLVGNNAIFTEYLNSLPLSAEMKWQIMNLAADPVYVLDRFYNALSRVQTELEHAYTVNADFINDFQEDIKRKSELDPESFLSGKICQYDSYIENGQIQFINLSVSFFVPMARNYTMFNDRLDVFFGYEYEKTLNYFSVIKVDPISMFKAFTDKSRVAIMELLKTQECCATDISKKLSIPMSSLVFHLSTLEAAGAVYKQQKGKKVLYKFNKDMFDQAQHYIQIFVA